MSKNDDEVLVRVEGVSKKFCRSLKKSLWYGVCDIAGELLPRRKRRETRDEGRELSDRSAQDISRSTLDSGLSTAAASALDSGPSPLDSTHGLRAGEFFAVKDVSFELRRGECLGLIGHNGAGKTTLLKMLNGLIKPDAGTITMRGRVGALIALGAGFNPILTGRENIYINGSVLGLTKKEIDAKIDEIIDFAEIREFIDMPVQSYSSGMSVRLGFAVSSSLKPDILIVDEVLAVGDLDFRMKCLERIRRLIDSGTTILLVSHSMVDIQRVCNRVVVMGRGIKQFDGHVGEGIARYELLGISNKGKPDCRNENSEKLKIHALSVNGIPLELGTRSAGAQMNTGDRLQIKIRIDFPRATSDVRFRLFADSARSGMIFSLTSAQKGKGKEIPSGNHSIEIEIENLPLLVGGYNIGFSVHCGETEVLASISNLFSLQIIGPEILGFARTNSGIVSIPVSWRQSSFLSETAA